MRALALLQQSPKGLTTNGFMHDFGVSVQALFSLMQEGRYPLWNKYLENYMAQNKEHIASAYPLPAYNYRVAIDAFVVSFAEVSGLSVEYEPVTYKHGLSYWMGDKIIPGMRQPVKLSMKKGIVKNNDYLHKWIHNTYTEPFYSNAKRNIVIDLCDEKGDAVIRWKVQQALPLKLDAPAFDANSNEVAIESMEFIAHGLEIDYHP